MASPALVAQLNALDSDALTSVICTFLDNRPDVAPSVVNFACPDLTYLPTKALTERRATGTIKSFNQEKGFGFVSCPDLTEIFGNDVFLHKCQMGDFQVGAAVSFAVLLNKDNNPQAFDLAMQGDRGGKGKGKDKGYEKGYSASPAWGNGAAGYGMEKGMGGGGGFGGKGDYGKSPMMGSKGMDKGYAGFGGAGKGAGKSKDVDDDTGGELEGRFQGTIKSFNEATGYGFIYSQQVKEAGFANDTFLHQHNALGFTVGEEVIFSVFMNAKGMPNARNLESTGQKQPAPQASGKAMGKSKSQDDGPELGQYQGIIKSFNEKTGYGFIDCPYLKENGYPGSDVFLHVHQAYGFNIGDEVMFTAYLSRNGKPNAKDLFYETAGPPNGVKRARLAF